jgi:hypothetical protein
MKLFRDCALIVVFALAAGPLSAHTISFIVGETGISPGAPAVEASNRWETGLLDAFFEEGHIVSNAPMMRLSAPVTEELPQEIRRDFFDAREGGVDFLIVALLEYQGLQGSRGRLRPVKVSLRLFRVTPYQFIIEEQFPLPGGTPDPDDLVNARQAALMMLRHLKE